MTKKYKRILLKLSGEALTGSSGNVHDPETIRSICENIKMAYSEGYEICLVVGGGNICRGASSSKLGIDRATGDYMGMLATVINAIAVQSVLESIGLYTRVQSAIPMTKICEQIIPRKAQRHIEKGRIVIFAAGTGNPYFTTDSAATLRAAEMHCDLVIKATQIDGVYSADPKKDPTAKRYDRLTFKDVMDQDLEVMDMTAITLARDNNIPIIVCNIHEKNGLLNALNGKGTFTIIE